MRMNGLANVRWLATHLDRKADFADEIAGMRAYDTAAHKALGR
jgi:hypothetical protein